MVRTYYECVVWPFDEENSRVNKKECKKWLDVCSVDVNLHKNVTLHSNILYCNVLLVLDTSYIELSFPDILRLECSIFSYESVDKRWIIQMQ